MITMPAVFQKAVLEDAEERRDPTTGYLFSLSRATVVVGSPEYNRMLSEGHQVIETWNVWRCQSCGMNDSDRDHAEWQAEHFGPVTHLARYGHESVRPE